MDDDHREPVRRLFVAATALIETVHEAAIAGQSEALTARAYAEAAPQLEAAAVKGQQAQAVILVDVDPRPVSDLDLRLLYCGMTRATVRLEILGRMGNTFNRGQLGLGKT